MVAQVLTASLVESLVKGIIGILNKKRPSKEELQRVRKDLNRIIKLAQDTGQGVGLFFELEQAAARAGVHATELQNFITDDKVPDSILLKSLDSLLGGRMVRLMKDGLRQIHEFRDDYEKAGDLAEEAKTHLTQCRTSLREKERKESLRELEYAVDRLDKLVTFVATRRDEMLKPLTKAYEVLVQEERP